MWMASGHCVLQATWFPCTRQRTCTGVVLLLLRPCAASDVSIGSAIKAKSPTGLALGAQPSWQDVWYVCSTWVQPAMLKCDRLEQHQYRCALLQSLLKSCDQRFCYPEGMALAVALLLGLCCWRPLLLAAAVCTYYCNSK
jgi:hypothetical protein